MPIRAARDLRLCAAGAASPSAASAVRRQRPCGSPAPAHRPRAQPRRQPERQRTSPSCSDGARAGRAASRARRQYVLLDCGFERVVVRGRPPSSDRARLRRTPPGSARGPAATAARGRRRRRRPRRELPSKDRPRTCARRPFFRSSLLQTSMSRCMTCTIAASSGAAGR